MTIIRGAYFAILLIVLRSAAATEAANYVTLERLSPRVALAHWVGTDRRCNLVALQSAQGLVIIDTEMSPRIMAPIKQRFEQHFGRSNWTYVINTHAHDSHAGGNCLFPGATIVGHANLVQDQQWLIRRQRDPDLRRRTLEEMDRTIRHFRALLPQVAHRAAEARDVRGEIEFWELHERDLREGYRVVPPTLTFSDRHTIDLGDLQLELVYFGRGHSCSDVLVYIPQEKILVSGSIVYQRAQLPEIGEQTDLHDLQRFLTVLDHFLDPESRIDHVIPSHSPPLLKSDLQPVRNYYRRMLEGVQQARHQGRTLDQAQQQLSIRSRFPEFRDPPPGHWAYGMHQRNVRNLWRILGENAPFAAPTLAPDSETSGK